MKKNYFLLILGFIGLSFQPLSVRAYVDVEAEHPYGVAISDFSAASVVKGYDGDLFRPEKKVNRAEFLKILLSAKGVLIPAEQAVDCFQDVPVDAWFAPYVCYAKEQGYVGGYADGTFKPGKELNVVEASTLAAKVFDRELVKEEGDDWYMPALRVLESEHALPVTFVYMNQGVTRSETVELAWRLLNKVTDKPSAKATDISGATCQSINEEVPDSVQPSKVEQAWLDWINAARADAGLKPYVLNRQLTRTATDWSNYSSARGYIDHKRPGQTAYYDYSRIVAWFKNLGLTFAQVGRNGTTENITWNVYSCAEPDCTDELIQSSRYGFNYFMSEKGKSYRPHYDSIMNPNYTMAGVGVAVDSSKKKFYLTVHYGTEITSDPAPVCPIS